MRDDVVVVFVILVSLAMIVFPVAAGGNGSIKKGDDSGEMDDIQ